MLRKDLGMNKGKMIAQGAHAAMMCLIDPRYNIWAMKNLITPWVQGSMAKIAVGVDDGDALDIIEAAAREAGLLVYAVIDSGKTVPACANTKTCVAIGPAPADTIDPITGHLKLL